MVSGTGALAADPLGPVGCGVVLNGLDLLQYISQILD